MGQEQSNPSSQDALISGLSGNASTVASGQPAAGALFDIVSFPFKSASCAPKELGRLPVGVRFSCTVVPKKERKKEWRHHVLEEKKGSTNISTNIFYDFCLLGCAFPSCCSPCPLALMYSSLRRRVIVEAQALPAYCLPEVH